MSTAGGYLRSYRREMALEGKKLKAIVERVKEFAELNGILMRPVESPSSSELLHHGPFTLFPSIIPRKIFSQAKDAQKDFNLLMHRVANDHDFLFESLKNVIKVDDFTKKLWDIYEIVRKEGSYQPLCLGLFRNDYMMDTQGREITDLDTLQLKQIEFNMIAVAFAGLSSQMRDVHRYSLSQADIEFDEEKKWREKELDDLGKYPGKLLNGQTYYLPMKMPLNNCVNGLARGIIKAWELYGKQSAYVLFIVENIERNRLDQMWVEKEVFNINRYCKVIYRTLNDMGRGGQLTDSKELMIDGMEIAVIYYRTGYSPTQYKSHEDWDARLKMERSKAIKCPTVHYQLAGTKKIQQELARKGAVERFLTDPLSIERVRQTFVGQYSLDKGLEGDTISNRAMKNPRKFVVKPQREGGGNNIYDDQIANFLQEHKDSDKRSAYIIMDRILPYVQKNYLVKRGEEFMFMNVVNEIGIFGVFFGSETDAIINDEVGYLLCTKYEDANEGGIEEGCSVLDTPYLVSSIKENFL